jgi:hypothetical protein
MSIPVEAIIHLDKFKPRDYQLPIFDAIENKGFKRVIAILPRRAGKDLACWNLLIRAAIRKVGVYWMCYPTYAQGKKILWDSVTNDGMRFLDYIPPQLIKSVNSQEMKIRLVGGSLLQVVGSDNVDNLVGTNARGIVFSEYALQDPRAYQLLRPVLTANAGFAVFISTPRGKNNLWELYNLAQANPNEWFAYMLTVHETQHIDLELIEQERRSGEMSDDMIEQEYFCSFSAGVEGSYYAKYLDKMRLKGQVGIVPWEPTMKVHTAWDIGLDGTAVIFFQVAGQVVRVIDYYEKPNMPFEYFIELVLQKKYRYGNHFGPHDLEHRVYTNSAAATRRELALDLGIEFQVIDRDLIADGIELVRKTLPRIWIDEVNAQGLIRCLENYRQEYDGKRKIYKGKPLHDNYSHGADALRYLCQSLSRTSDSISSKEREYLYREAMYGTSNSNIPAALRDDVYY